MNIVEAQAWLRGERSWTNSILEHPHETWLVRIAEADAAATQQAYWIVKAHVQQLMAGQNKPGEENEIVPNIVRDFEAENGQLRERIRTLEAGIEQEAREADDAAEEGCMFGRARVHHDRAARLRELLQDGGG